MSSTAWWNWDARLTSAWPNLGQGWDQCARSPEPCKTTPSAILRFDMEELTMNQLLADVIEVYCDFVSCHFLVGIQSFGVSRGQSKSGIATASDLIHSYTSSPRKSKPLLNHDWVQLFPVRKVSAAAALLGDGMSDDLALRGPDAANAAGASVR